MSARRPLQPLSPLSPNIVGAKYSYVSKVGANVEAFAIMDEQAHDDNTQGPGSVASDLTSLENDADDFDRLMIQNARDERRLHDALRGNVKPFRKARPHPRIGLTLENLERNNAQSHGGQRLDAPAKWESPSSSSGSAPSDPAIRPPAEWGRKSRRNRSWMRTITSEEEQDAGAQEDTIARLAEDMTPKRTDRWAGPSDAHVPRASVEDSPLSRKSSLQGTPASSRRRNMQLEEDPDWTLDFNEASMIASTPYIPRNTALDDIRQREIESLREQAVTTNRLDKIRESSPEETRRARSSSRNSLSSQTNGAATTSEQLAQEALSPEKQRRRRTGSWKAMGQSHPVTGEAGEAGEQQPKSPILVHNKSSETVGAVDRALLANAQTSPKRPAHRREDSHDLLRRLARVSSTTPSPGRVAASRPQTAPSRTQVISSLKVTTETSQAIVKDPSRSEERMQESTAAESVATAPEAHSPHDKKKEAPQRAKSSPAPAQALPPSQHQATVDVDATPIPVESTLLNAKTPVVTGAWVDTPVPRTVRWSNEAPSMSSQSPEKGSPSKRSLEKQKAPQLEEEPEEPQIEPERNRPNLPGSALEAIVEEARANGHIHRHEDQYGDSTIDSLEELIAPDAEDSEAADLDDDTLQGLQLPTEPPRNEAERQRQKELAQLHKMNQRLRAARTSIRDASRGMKRVENRVEHVEEGGAPSSPWATVWTAFKGLFYNPDSPRRAGLTWLSIALLSLLLWFISESLACDKYCHKLYATRMVGFGVNWDAPRYPFVLPTVLYRNLLRPFWRPFWAFLSWIGRTTYNCCLQDETTRASATESARRFATKILVQTRETFETDFSMHDDEII